MSFVKLVMLPVLDIRQFPKTYKPKIAVVVDSFIFIASFILLSNSLMNCIIYSIRSHRFRECIKEIKSVVIYGFFSLKYKLTGEEAKLLEWQNQYRHNSGTGTILFSLKTTSSRRNSKQSEF